MVQHYDEGSSSGSPGKYANPQPPSPSGRRTVWIILGVIAVIAAGFWMGDKVRQAYQRDQDAKATQTTVAAYRNDVNAIYQTIRSQIPGWETVKDTAVHRVDASDAGFDPDSTTKEVDYGYCVNNIFYIFVLQDIHPGGVTPADTMGYAYTTQTDPTVCHPDGWTIVKDSAVDASWHFVAINTFSATFAAQNARTSQPSSAPSSAAPTAGKK